MSRALGPRWLTPAFASAMAAARRAMASTGKDAITHARKKKRRRGVTLFDIADGSGEIPDCELLKGLACIVFHFHLLRIVQTSKCSRLTLALTFLQPSLQFSQRKSRLVAPY